MAESNNGSHLTPDGGRFQFVSIVTLSIPHDETESGNTDTSFSVHRSV